MGARPTGGSFKDTGSQFQSITSYSGAEAHHRPLQPRNGQTPLPVIAPQPTQQDCQTWVGMKPFGMMPAYPDRPYDTSTYTSSDLPPHLLQEIAQRNCSLDTSPVTPKIDTFAMNQAGFPPQELPGHHADRDSGVDVSCPGFRSEWSHSSTLSSNTPTTIGQTYPNNELSTSEAQHLDQSHALSEVPFQSPAITSYQRSWQVPILDAEVKQFWPSQISAVSQGCYDPIQAMSTMKYAPSYDQAAGYEHLNGMNPFSYT